MKLIQHPPYTTIRHKLFEYHRVIANIMFAPERMEESEYYII